MQAVTAYTLACEAHSLNAGAMQDTKFAVGVDHKKTLAGHGIKNK